MKYLDSLKQSWQGILIAAVIGITAVMIDKIVQFPILDPLVVAMVIGIIIRSFMPVNGKYIAGFNVAPSLFIPFGLIFYGAVNLNFAKFATLNTNFIFILGIVFLIYIISILLLSHVFGINEKKGFLIAAGSAICGASAIVITSKAIDAEPDDVSTSLIAVFVSALIGLFVLLPLLASYFKITGINYGVFSGTVLQFTGFVKASVINASGDVKAIALLVKTVRYVGLLLIIPLFASLVKGRLYIPWYLWAFLCAGLAFTFIPGLTRTLGPACKVILTVLWSISMAAIGLMADIKKIFSRVGIKACGVSFISFVIALGVLLIGIKFM